MSGTVITYVIYISTTPEKLWEALTSFESLKRNWGRIESQWTVGARVTESSDSGKLLWEGKVLKSEPPRLLSYTFDVTSSRESLTVVTFELEVPVSEIAPGEQIVRLTLTQDGFESDSGLHAGCAHAWPEILSSIKSDLERGRPLGFAWKH